MSNRDDRYLEIDQPHAVEVAAFLKRRMAALNMHSHKDLRDAAEVSQPTISELLSAEPGRRWRSKIRAVSQAVAGQPDAIEEILRGAEPTIVEEDVALAARVSRVEDELRRQATQLDQLEQLLDRDER